ncbi:hypothetical protein [Leucobacter manosquensis]|uniref:Uncharacterized protein n=1 Tax=Leucobacter manosquensis TaxID=2810611 RepID=A0ABS5M598_9MICO|nr:hypothetical protein [Leucobacter manosquensis]MBS3182368.1 hypothetical protein [Leucobacter manosquensis]
MDTETTERSVVAELEHLEFWQRVDELRAAGRIGPHTELQLQKMAEDSSSIQDFKARLLYGGPRLMDATEQRYLTSAMDTPEGRRPESWAESSAHVRAFGADQYQGNAVVQQRERDRQVEVTRVIS